MTPTEEINRHLTALRAAAGNLKPDAEAALQLVEMHARQHAHQIETREEYIRTVEAKAGEVDSLKQANARLAANLEAIEGTPEAKAAKGKKLREQQAAIAAELAKLEAVG